MKTFEDLVKLKKKIDDKKVVTEQDNKDFFNMISEVLDSLEERIDKHTQTINEIEEVLKSEKNNKIKKKKIFFPKDLRKK